ncbi:bifunctional phosphopantothenoylcysteine decarboxylase/phosphopantothenate--cysteine ligase CoaBC [Ruminococcus sp.]|uniref:bifunctional phosphopantothenoylcysteine decarboxylase/phosphopantothenate--cysteine ligase CoaBC n=1 Tax=Ruminococcus sp. TaxID=41978 RepID=UPI0025CBA896|nr:bifunctional phosphopantothenoylcysteine decarboxylase/phosphopantothenate--cysteine ligase CoaBC [Ruminococcus sp.]MBQ9543017.1 bifunctional phosphopantothenoylcysteine decarboxylase/phosphopantothenate--cysteine ligase CoaBC [Ruminococcus sp.]
MLKGKCAVLGVTGSIAAYKIPNLARLLKKQGCDVEILMTPNACNFINPITFESLVGHKCLVDTFDRNFQYSVEHVALAKKADVVMIAPASANVIGKIASGIADDMLTTTVMACNCTKIFSPAMNHNMFHNPIVQDNIEKLRKFGYQIVEPEQGMLANGDSGDGRMPEPEVLYEYILREIACEKDLAGKKVLVTAGATRESIDPVRFITNHSSGKMGIAVAKAAMLRGADVTLVAGHVEAKLPPFVRYVPVESAEDMFRAVTQLSDKMDIIVKAAAVADYTPLTTADSKLKKSDADMSIPLKRTKDILKTLGERKRDGQIICGFSMETDNVLENSSKKLVSKNCDMICANSLRTAGAGFGTDTNVITMITKSGAEELPLMSKEEAAHKILDKLLTL